MILLKPLYYDQDFTIKSKPKSTQSVDNLSWNCIGGPDQASITAIGPAAGVWEFAEYLRCPVEIYNDKGQCVWWGYVNDVQISYGALNWGISLDDMFNSIAVAYSFVEAGSQDVGQRKTTAYATDADSIAIFGTKQLLQSASGMTDAAATSLRDNLLAMHKYPNGIVTSGALNAGSPGMAAATITCKGWFSTFSWKYAAVAAGALVDTTTQIANIVSTYGQFVTVADLDAVSGVTSSPYRDGETSALREITALLSMGNSSGKRLLASVNVGGRLRVYAEPANTTIGAMLDRLGYLYDLSGRKITPFNPPVGVWCILKDVLPSTVDTSRIINPTLQFIESMEWSPNNGLIPKFRGQADLYDTLGGF